MTALFEWLFKYRPIVFQKGGLAFHPLLPWLGLAAAATAAGVFAYLLYRGTRGIVPGSVRAWLAVLRAVPLLVVLGILMQPVLVLRSVIPQKSFLAVAYDASRSMAIRDAGGGRSRLEEVARLLDVSGSRLLADLGAKFQLRFFRISRAAERVEGFQAPGRPGSVTDLEASLEQVAAELGDVPLSGILLLTDGADNRSRDLEGAAERLRAKRIPVYPVGIGSPDIARDAEVLRVSAPRRVLKNALVEAEISVSARGYAGRRTRLAVRQGEGVLHSREITLGGDDEVKTYKVTFACQGTGAKILTFDVEPLAGELVPENNDRQVLIRVEDAQPKILYVEGEPRWIYRFMRRAAAEDADLALVTLLRQAEGKLYRQGVESGEVLARGFPADKAELYPFKALILGSVEASFFTFDQLRLISDFVSERGGGFLVLGGRNSYGQGGYANTPLEDVLPVAVRADSGAAAAPAEREARFRARLTAYGQIHPITRIAADEQENRKRWDGAAPLVGYNPTAGAKPGATVLATADLGARGGDEPVLLAFQRFGRGRSVALTTDAVWRWRMEHESRDNFHELFWKQMMRWLVADAPDPLTVESERDSYAPGESVTLRAEARDSTFLSLNDARVTAAVRAPSGRTTTVPLAWDPRKEGAYTARFLPEEEGIYEAAAEFYRQEQKLGTATANFRVADSFEEYHAAAMNAGLLQRLAERSGGRYYTPRDLDHLAEDISYVDSGSSRIEEKDLWDMPAAYLLLVSSMVAEWILRKRKGLA